MTDDMSGTDKLIIRILYSGRKARYSDPTIPEYSVDGLLLAMKELDSREANILELWYGIGGVSTHTYKQIGLLVENRVYHNKSHITATRVGQLLYKAIRKLSHPSRRNLFISKKACDEWRSKNY